MLSKINFLMTSGHSELLLPILLHILLITFPDAQLVSSFFRIINMYPGTFFLRCTYKSKWTMMKLFSSGEKITSEMRYWIGEIKKGKVWIYTFLMFYWCFYNKLHFFANVNRSLSPLCAVISQLVIWRACVPRIMTRN